jgi:group I intron endonuclease
MDTYKATNTVNGKFYVGSTNNFEWRKYCHLNQKKNYPFQNALRKNPSAFEWEVWTDDSDEPILEQALLDMWFGTEQCYNLNPIASRPPSQKGKVASEESRKKMSEAGRGRKHSTETKGKISVSVSGEKNGGFGKTGSLNSSYGTRREKHPASKKVEVTHPDGSSQVFSCLVYAAEALGVSKASVGEAARKNHTKTKGSLTGYSFRYLPE